MKNIKLNLKKTAKAGFSLVEMLVVIAVIGVIAAIAIPNIGNINDGAKKASATRNAQSIASTLNAAIAAGADLGAAAMDQTALIALAEGTTVTPTEGVFVGKVFTVGTLSTETKAAMADPALFPAGDMIAYDPANKQITYNAPAN